MDPRETVEQSPVQPDAAAEPVAEPVEPEDTPREPADGPPETPERTMPGPPDTGDARVDEAVRPLADLGDRPPGDHVEAYEQAHSGLQETLADLDKRAEDDREGG